EIDQNLLDVVEHFGRQPGINADEEGVVHDLVGVRQTADHAMGDVLEGRLAEQVASEELASLYLALVQVSHQLGPRERGAVTKGEQEAEPGGVGVRSGSRQDQVVLVRG